MTKRNRFLTTLLTIAVAFVMLTSVAYIAKESHHECVGTTAPSATSSTPASIF